MANYQSLKAAINAVIKANGNKEITGTVLNEVLLAMVNSLGAGYQFAGVATPDTTPGTPDQKVFYIASQAGTYINFGGAVVSDGIAIFEWNGTWTTEILDLSMAGQVQSDWTETDTTKKSYIKHKPNIPPSANVDTVPTNGSPNAVASGGVYNALKTITDFLNNGYYFVGIAGTSTVPDSVTQYGIFYIASDGGTYTNFLNGDDEPLTLYQGLNILYKNVEDDGWNYFEVFKFSDFVDTTQQQSLSTKQKAQARTNIAAVSYDQQSLNAEQQVQAQNNIVGKVYNAAAFSGLGKKVLAKNVEEVGGINKNYLTQAFFKSGNTLLTNTVFVIQYDYELKENVEIGAGCTLQFDGGSISGSYTLTGNNTDVIAGLVKIFDTHITFAGTWNVSEACPEWFGALGDGATDDIVPIQACVDWTLPLHIPMALKKSYYISSAIMVNYSINDGYGNRKYEVRGYDAKIVINTNAFDSTLEGTVAVAGNLLVKGVTFTSANHNKHVMTQKLIMVVFVDCTFNTLLVFSTSYLQTINLLNCNIAAYSGRFITTSGGCHNVVLNNCRVEASWGNLLWLTTETEQGVDFTVTNCLIEGIRESPVIYLLRCDSGVITNCYFEGNKKGDIYAWDDSGASNNLKLMNNIFGEMYPEEGDTPYHVSWWGTAGSISMGNIGLDGAQGHRFRVAPVAGFYINDSGYSYNSYTVGEGVPATPSQNNLFVGMQRFDTTAGKLKVYNGSTWVTAN